MKRWCAVAVATAMSMTSAAAVGAAATNLDALPMRGVVADLVTFATIPDNSFGSAPRLNAMAFLGERIFVVEERDGLIYELTDDGSGGRSATVFFDVKAAIAQATDRQLDTANLFHGGLRSVAFHPDFDTNGLFYVSAMETRPTNTTGHRYISDAETPVGADSVLLEFTFDHEESSIDSESYREVFRVGMPVYDHPIKQIAFDADATGPERGLLYVAHGDGSVLSAIAGGGQNNDALGKILRIDPQSDGRASYSIPPDNPFIGDPSIPDEVYSIGHRNPHQLAFARDPASGGRLLIAADAGRDNAEEINLISAGADYGWPRREGTFVHLPGGGLTTGIEALPLDDAVNGFVYPAAQYLHDGEVGTFSTGEAVAGGYVVDNGSELSGQYFFADFPIDGVLLHAAVSDLAAAVQTIGAGQSPTSLTQAAIGVVDITFDHDNDPETDSLHRSDLRDVFDDAPGYESERADVRFGQGPDGELYVMSKRNNTIYLVTNSVPPTPDPVNDDLPLYLDDQILRLYRAALGRTPDLDGLRYWVERRQSGVPLIEIARDVISSPEFTARYGSGLEPEELVALLYENVLDREGEADGVAFWVEQLSNGSTPAAVVLAFSDSPENVARTATTAPITDDQARVLRLYRAAFGRTPDADGMAFWVQRVGTGEALVDIARQFRQSPEFNERYGPDLTDGAFVNLLYRNVLGRSGEDAGLAFWLGQLAEGRTRDQVLLAFSDSPENLVRTNTQP